jgi:hypothetical protein
MIFFAASMSSNRERFSSGVVSKQSWTWRKGITSMCPFEAGNLSQRAYQSSFSAFITFGSGVQNGQGVVSGMERSLNGKEHKFRDASVVAGKNPLPAYIKRKKRTDTSCSAQYVAYFTISGTSKTQDLILSLSKDRPELRGKNILSSTDSGYSSLQIKRDPICTIVFLRLMLLPMPSPPADNCVDNTNCNDCYNHD